MVSRRSAIFERFRIVNFRAKHDHSTSLGIHAPQKFENQQKVRKMHFLLVLKLLRSMDPETGRVVMLSSEVHDPEHPNA
jgi:hypothetical protein